MRRRLTRTLLAASLGLTLSSSAWAQAAFAPRLIEFLPASRDAAVTADAGAISRYDLEIVPAGSDAPLQRVKLGLPAVSPDGLMRLDVAARLTVVPVAGLAYTARILSVGPTGTTASAASNAFTFTAVRPAATQAEVRTVVVRSEAALQAAVAGLTSNTTIVLAPGRYRLTATLRVAGPLTGVVLTGSTGRATDVVLEGAGMTAASAAVTAIAVTGQVQGLAIADLTIRQFAGHAISFAHGPQAPRLTNLRLTDTGRALVAVAAGVHDGLIEHASFDYTTTGLSAAAGGLDLQGVRGWTVRLNAFRNVRGPVGVTAGAAVAASAGSADTLVTENLFIDCGRGIALGLTNVADGVDHRGGRIANNGFVRAATVAGGAGISVTDSPATVVEHNTVLTAGTAAAIVARFADSVDLRIANNLTDGPVQARDGAWAIETGNVSGATADLFVDAAAGDLHLRSEF